jgi:hypothetical protein
VKRRQQDSNLRAADRLRVSNALPCQLGHASERASRRTPGGDARRARRRAKRKERESNPQGPRPTRFRDGVPRRWQSFREVTPAGLEPAHPRVRAGSSACLSYGVDVAGRSRTWGVPRFMRALCRAELRPRVTRSRGVQAVGIPPLRPSPGREDRRSCAIDGAFRMTRSGQAEPMLSKPLAHPSTLDRPPAGCATDLERPTWRGVGARASVRLRRI